MRLRTVAFVFLALVIAAVSALVVAANRGRPFLPETVVTDPAAYDIGMTAYRNGDFEAAREWLRRVPEDHPDYARAMRFLGFNVLARELGDPREGVRFVNASLLGNPFDGNVWQDLVRIYLRSLGLDVL